VTLPILGPPYLPPLARKYPCGFRQVGPLALYTTRGLGTTFLPIRLDSPPEITSLTLRSVLAAPPRTWIPAKNKRPLFPIQELFG
jgi:predicted MPP superfamily phosphohydrolase